MIKTPVPTKYSDCYTLSGPTFDPIRISEEEAQAILRMQSTVKPLQKARIPLYRPQISFKRACLVLEEITINWYNEVGVKHTVKDTPEEL